MAMKWMNITCKQATILLSKKEEKQLGLLDRLKLKGHLAICSVCRLFALQTEFIRKHASHIHTDSTLSPEAKEKMHTALTKNS
jgi:hypothetical protein